MKMRNEKEVTGAGKPRRFWPRDDFAQDLLSPNSRRRQSRHLRLWRWMSHALALLSGALAVFLYSEDDPTYRFQLLTAILVTMASLFAASSFSIRLDIVRAFDLLLSQQSFARGDDADR